MAVTRLERKGLRNKARAKARKQRIKELSKQPPIKNVDVEAIKEEFAKKSGKPTAKKKEEKKEAAPKAESTPKEEVKAEAAPAKEAKKEALKAEAAPAPEKEAEEEVATADSTSSEEADSTDTSTESKEDEPQADGPQAELREPAKAPREDAEMIEDKIEGEDTEKKA